MPRTSTFESRSTGRGRERPSPRGRVTAARGANPITQCIEVCNETLGYCLDQGGDHASREHILGLLDCIDTCWYVTGLQARDSGLAEEALRLCADACKRCEESCEAFEGDETMQRCADVCRETYEHCRR
jgi:hypothetical protein